MWFLYFIENNNDQKVLLRPSREYTLGRRDCDILVLGDKSISKAHATLKIEDINEEYITKIFQRPVVTFYDDSKFGSYVNAKKVEKGKTNEVYLNDGDIIKLGTRHSLFKLKWEPMVICRQKLSKESKSVLYNTVLAIGAKVTQNISEPFTHLYMEKLEFSYKVARCLALAKPIISYKWLDALFDSSDIKFEFPPIDDTSYLPPIDESCNGGFGIPDFKPNPLRSKLFKYKIFLFFDEKQYDHLKGLVQAAGGTCQLHHSEKFDPVAESIGSSNKIVIQPKQVNQPTWNSIVNYLDSCERRVVDESDIGWAIAYCSMDVYCRTGLDQDPPLLSQNEYLMQPSAPSMDVRMSYEMTPSALIPTIFIPSVPSSSTSKQSVSNPYTSKPSNSTSFRSTSNNLETSTYKPSTSRSVSASTSKDPEIKEESDLADLFDDLIGGDDILPVPANTALTSKSTSISSTSNFSNSASTSKSTDAILKDHTSHEKQVKTRNCIQSIEVTRNSLLSLDPEENDAVTEKNNQTTRESLIYSIIDDDSHERNNNTNVNNDSSNSKSNRKLNNNNNNNTDPIAQPSSKNYLSDLHDHQEEEEEELPQPSTLYSSSPSSSSRPSSSYTSSVNEDNKKAKKEKGRKKRRADLDQLESSSLSTATEEANRAKKQRLEEDLLPELRNEDTTIVDGKKYTNIKYKKMVLTPRNNLQAQQESSSSSSSSSSPSNVKNVKKFKKVTPTHNNPLQIITMQSEQNRLNTSVSNPSGTTTALYTDFDDIRIRPTRVRF